jgi:hypothetical protein
LPLSLRVSVYDSEAPMGRSLLWIQGSCRARTCLRCMMTADFSTTMEFFLWCSTRSQSVLNWFRVRKPDDWE